MKFLILIIYLSKIFSYYNIENHKAIVSFINKLRTTWKAKLYIRDVTPLFGAFKETEETKVRERKTFYASRSYLPDFLDLRTEYKKCNSIKEIYDQSSCGSCWALAATGTMTDRLCILTGGRIQTKLSATELITCCDSCGLGCLGGYPSLAFKYWKNNGIPSGGSFGDKQTCKPYFLPPGKDNITEYVEKQETPECENKCQEGYNKSLEEDKFYANEIYSVSGEENIMKEIYENGPVESIFTVYDDFVDYDSGVYQHVTGSFLGGLTVKIIGWGITDDGVKYWIVANNWGESWGEKGFFRILKGENECGIEEYAVTGMPKI